MNSQGNGFGSDRIAPGRGNAALRRMTLAWSRVHDGARGGLATAGRLAVFAVLTVGALATLAGLVLLPSPIGSAHVAIAAGAALLVAAAVICAVDDFHSISSDVAPQRERYARLIETLERRLEKMQDVHWQISESDVRYRDLLDAQLEVILRRDEHDRLTFVNQAFVKTFGIPADEALGRPFAPRVIEGSGVSPLRTGDGERSRTYEERLETTAGSRWIAWNEHVVASGVGDGFEVQAVGRDVTEDRRMSAALAEARDQAEAANRAKSRFLAAMSHEIRTPMNGILGMAGLMREQHLTEEQRTYADAIDQSARALLTLIDEILDFSKIEAGKLVINDAPFSLAASAQSVVELLSPRAHEKGLELALNVDPMFDAPVVGDAYRVRQIMLNLLSNAVKFTDRGGIAVTIAGRHVGDDERRLHVSVAVEDSGIGLSTEEMRQLFTEFEQAETAVRRQQGGTGLGLAISRRIAMAMGGEIRVTSAPGRGSTFIAEFFVKENSVSSHDAKTTAAGTTDHHVVLLALNHRMERASIARILRAAGHVAIEASMDEAQSVIASAAAEGTPVDRLVVDVGCDARIAGELLAAARAVCGKTLIGLVTVNVLARAGLSAFRDNGFDRYLVRPVRAHSLLRQIAEHPGPEGRSAVELAAGGATPPAEKSLPRTSADAAADVVVLLVEDNDINALLATRVLERCGCCVEHCRNGDEAVKRAIAAMTGGTPQLDLILMDIFMPGIDGLAAAKLIREAHARMAAENPGCLPPLPAIVALTANAFPEDRARYLSEGMDDYLAKPFDVRDLVGVLDHWVPSRSAVGPRKGAVAGR
ncbi:MAG: response regulator [Hyphomicrobiaceae bacterium]|nr:response regulator [Hyphomicrobiaceae bacterium]